MTSRYRNKETLRNSVTYRFVIFTPRLFFNGLQVGVSRSGTCREGMAALAKNLDNSLWCCRVECVCRDRFPRAGPAPSAGEVVAAARETQASLEAAASTPDFSVLVWVDGCDDDGLVQEADSGRGVVVDDLLPGAVEAEHDNRRCFVFPGRARSRWVHQVDLQGVCPTVEHQIPRPVLLGVCHGLIHERMAPEDTSVGFAISVRL